ncbi:MAG: hypothetical protein HYR89_10520 [Actinobacteria bacterium]|nr:hypothetical protein [Actinomycetota bacterium]
MRDIYGTALKRIEKMRLEAAEIRREQRSGQAWSSGWVGSAVSMRAPLVNVCASLALWRRFRF